MKPGWSTGWRSVEWLYLTQVRRGQRQWVVGMSVSQEIKNRLDIVEVVSAYMPLRKAGRRYTGFCPFHHNVNTPSFYVFPETQTWHCFGACATGGDVFSFVMRKEGMDFRDALRFLADKAGVRLEESAPQDQAQQAAEDRLATLLETAADYFHQLFLYAPQGEIARRYVEGRAFSATTIETFKLGYALDSWDACRNHFQAQGYSQEEMLEAGLLTLNEERGVSYDRFRHRLMIPIRDVQGRVVGFGARTLDKDGLPKYLNSPQTTLFDKGHLLFNLDQSRRHIREARQAVIVEGYLDVLQAWQAGFRNVVAQMGTALTEAQLNLLKRYTRQFVIALDGDAAGLKATWRSLEVARDTLDREVESLFDVRGLVRHEGRLKADMRVAALPEGCDPDDLIRRNPADWALLVERARPIVAYVMEVATRDLDMTDAKAKSAVAHQLAPLIQDVADPVERDHYWQALARALRVDERALRRLRPEEKGFSVATAPAAAPETPAPPGDQRQTHYLRTCLANSFLLRRVDQVLLRVQQPPVVADDFALFEDRAVWEGLRRCSLAGRQVVSIDELCDSLDIALAERVRDLWGMAAMEPAEPERLPDKLARSVLDWRLDKVRQMLRQLRQLVAEAESAGDWEALEMHRAQSQVQVMLHASINKAKQALTAPA